MSQQFQNEVCLEHKKPAIFEDEQNIFCIECIKIAIGNGFLMTPQQMRCKKQHFLMNALGFADQVSFLYIEFYDQLDKEMEVFISVMQEFKQKLKETMESASSMRLNAYYKCSEFKYFQEMEGWYYKEQESYQELRNIMEQSMRSFSLKIEELQLIFQNHQSLFNKEEQNQQDKINEFKNPKTEFTNEYEILSMVLNQLKMDQLQSQLEHITEDNGASAINLIFNKIGYGIQNLICDLVEENEEAEMMKSQPEVITKQKNIEIEIEQDTTVDQDQQAKSQENSKQIHTIQQDNYLGSPNHPTTGQIYTNILQERRQLFKDSYFQSSCQEKNKLNVSEEQGVMKHFFFNMNQVSDDIQQKDQSQNQEQGKETVKSESQINQIEENFLSTNSIQNNKDIKIKNCQSQQVEGKSDQQQIELSEKQKQGKQSQLSDSCCNEQLDEQIILTNNSTDNNASPRISEQKIQVKQDKIKYNELSICKIKESQWCDSFEFNKEETLVFIGRRDCCIKAYEFNNGIIQNEIQTLSNHSKDVSCLIYLDKSGQLVSGSDDNSIIIWNKDQNNLWKLQQRLYGHNDWIRCITKNVGEDLLISGSRDNSIKFWRKENKSWSCQQTIKTNFDVFSLSLNPLETKLIICGQKNHIKVVDHQSELEWVVTQTIKVNEWGYRLCFIDDNQFVFQPQTNGVLQIYNYFQEKKQFVLANQVEVQNCSDCRCYFPIQYIVSKNILMVKHGKYLNFFEIDQKVNFILKQSIEFDHEWAQYGKLTEDGQFLVTWDKKSEELQSRRMQYQE